MANGRNVGYYTGLGYDFGKGFGKMYGEGKISAQFIQEIIEATQAKGRALSKEEYSDIIGSKGISKHLSYADDYRSFAKANADLLNIDIAKDTTGIWSEREKGEVRAQQDQDAALETEEGAEETEETTTSDYFFDPRKGFTIDPETGEIVRGEGAEGDLYELLLRSQQEQATEGTRLRDEQARDFYRDLEQDRRATMQDVRQRRRGQLKSGLTQAQIANEEISQMIAGQQMRAQGAQQFRQQQAQQDMWNTPAQQAQRAAQGMYGLATGFNTPGSAFYAASQTDPRVLTDWYGGLNRQQRESADRIYGRDQFNR